MRTLLDGLGGDPFAAERFRRGGNEPPPELGPMFAEAAKTAHLDPNWQRRQMRGAAQYLGAGPEWQERLVAGADMLTPLGLTGGLEDAGRAAGEGEYLDAGLLAGLSTAGWLAGPLAGLAKGAVKGARKAKKAPEKPPEGKMQELDDFLADPGPDRRRWVRGNGLEMYVRRPSSRTLEIDSVTAENPGQGALGRFLDAYEGDNAIFIENIMNERLADYLRRRGYEINGDFGNMSRTVSASKRRER